MISEIIDKVLQEVKSVDKLCAPSREAADDLSLILKNLYDSSVQISRKKVGPLDKLAVAGLDDETIWEEIQTRNKPLLRYLTKLVTRLKKKVQAAEILEASDDDDEEMDVDVEDLVETEDVEGDEEEDESMDEGEEDENESAGAIDSDDDEGDFDESRDDFVGSGSEQEDDHNEGDELVGDSEDDMEAWLDREDELEMNRAAREERRNKKADKKQTADSDDEDADGEADEEAFVQQHMYEDDGGDDSDGDEAAGNADYKFSDFFVADKSERRAKARAAGKVVKCKQEATLKFSLTKSAFKKSKKQQARSISDSDNEDDSEEEEEEGSFGGDDNSEEEEDGEDWDDEEDDEEEEEEGENEVTPAPTKSSGKATATQQRNQALSSQIASLEEELMSAKPWELRGEVKAVDRPENSFLELHADIERTSKPAPVVTQAFTSSMEDMIKRRVKEGNFSDVLPPKEAKITMGDEGTGEQDLSQEKNKQGLGEVYAEEFLAKSLNAQPEAVSKRLEQARLEAQEIFHKISRELDALSHFHYTPRPVVPDSKIRTLQTSGGGSAPLSSLQLEDVTPLTSAQASTSQLAPEQVFEKKHGKQASLMAEEEMTSDDRKRARRASKASNKAKKARVEDEKLLTGAKEGPGSAREKLREENKAIDEELKRDSRVLLTTPGPAGSSNKKVKTASAQDSTAYAKSSSFFSRLQQETTDQIKKKTSGKPGKSPVTNPFALSANSVKL